MHSSTIYVTYKYGAYSTNRVHGRSASRTSGPLDAAQALAEKLYGKGLKACTETSEGTTFTRRFEASGEALLPTPTGVGRRAQGEQP